MVHLPLYFDEECATAVTEEQHAEDSHQVCVHVPSSSLCGSPVDGTVQCVLLLTCRVIVAVLNSFHFDVRVAAPLLADGTLESEASNDDPMDSGGGAVESGGRTKEDRPDEEAALGGDAENGEEEGSVGSAAAAQKIHNSICTSVLPELKECLVKQVSSTFLYML